jgi:hypothetical protein
MLMALVVGAVVALAVAMSAAAAPPQEKQQPSVEGTPTEGNTLTANNGQWTNDPLTFTYQWQRCDQNVNNCNSIAGARDKTYRLTDDDVGRRIRVLVTATNADGSTTANSKATEVVSSNEAPRMRERPSISGRAIVGSELTADPGEWTGFPRFSYQWQRCDANGNNCEHISGATARVYGVRSVDQGQTLRVRVTATTGGGSSSATSDRTAAVAAGTTTPPPAPPVGVGGALSVTAVSLPNRLVISQVQFSPRVINNRNQPVVARFKVSDMQGNRPVAGALVYAIGVPENRISNEGERQTDSSGWATFTYRVLPGLPMKAGARMTFFVRARKPGDSILAGVSSRRLVSVGVSPR